MKPGMQREILVAYWLLFDEFDIGSDDVVQTSKASVDSDGAAKQGPGTAPMKPRVQSTKPRRNS